MHLDAAFSSDSDVGLFAQQSVDPQAQDALLLSVARQLSQESKQACEGPLGKGMSVGELDEPLASLPRNKRPGSDGLPYEFYMSYKSWGVAGPPLLQCHVFSEAFCPA